MAYISSKLIILCNNTIRDMKIIISPAKKLDFTKIDSSKLDTQIIFNNEAHSLIKILSSYSEDDIMQLMSVSKQIAKINVDRFNTWQKPSLSEKSKQAIFAFKGAVYQSMNPESFTIEDQVFCQNNLRIISGLYGLLKPFDKILPYRLEMGTKLTISNSISNLYSFWGDKITNALLDDCDLDEQIVNLASNEYSKVIDLRKFNSVITPVFKDFKNGKLKTISFLAKKARGEMCNFIIKNQINNISDLKRFNNLGYSYSDENDKNEIMFIR